MLVGHSLGGLILSQCYHPIGYISLSEPKPEPFSVKNPADAEQLLAWIEQLKSPEKALPTGFPVYGLGGKGESLISTQMDTFPRQHSATFSPSILNDENRDSGTDQDSISDSTGSLTSEGTLTSADTAADLSENDRVWSCCSCANCNNCAICASCNNCANCANCGWNCFNCIDETISRLKLERYHRRRNIELWEKALQTISEPIPFP